MRRFARHSRSRPRRRIAVQLHGEPLPGFVESLRAGGAEEVGITVNLYAVSPATDISTLKSALDELLSAYSTSDTQTIVEKDTPDAFNQTTLGGALADRIGRGRMLGLGWLVGLQFEKWFGSGRVGARVNGALSERPITVPGRPDRERVVRRVAASSRSLRSLEPDAEPIEAHDQRSGRSRSLGSLLDVSFRRRQCFEISVRAAREPHAC